MPRGGYGSAQGRLAATRDLYKFGSFCFHIKNQTSKIKIAESPAAMSFLFRTELSKNRKRLTIYDFRWTIEGENPPVADKS
jgi:hypothetical protein